MKVAGFTIIKNAVKFDFPVVEAISSILPVCDEFIVAVGQSDDGTRALIESIDSPKIKIIDTIWDEEKYKGQNGTILAVETNKALAAVSEDADWAFYIQSDECVHEKYLPEIKAKMEKYKDAKEVDGLLFKYQHFFGSYDYVGASLSWYRREIRIIKNRKDIFSYLDAQGFRKKPNDKLQVKLIDAEVYHYGWVREPDKFTEKLNFQQKLWHDDGKTFEKLDLSEVSALNKFEGTHPAVIADRIAKMNWKFAYDVTKNNYSFKDKFKLFVGRVTGWTPFVYKNYKLLK